MADLSKAFKNYCNKSKYKSTLHRFVNNNDYHKELIITWFEIYHTSEDAMNNLIRNFKQVYKDSTKASYKSKTIPDLRSLFTQSELQKPTMKNSGKILNESINTTREKLVLLYQDIKFRGDTICKTMLVDEDGRLNFFSRKLILL